MVEEKEEEKITTETDSTETDSTETDPIKKLGVITTLAVVVMILTPIMLWLTIKAMLPAKRVITVNDQQFYKIVLPMLDVNLKEGNSMRYAQVEIMVTVSDVKMKKFFEKNTTENPKGQLQRIRAMIIEIISQEDVSDVLSATGTKKVQREIRRRLNDLFVDDTKGIVRKVYFNHFLVQ